MRQNLKNYQRKAVDQTKKLVKTYFEFDNQTIVLKAPTGSGKTFMISALMEELVEDYPNNDFCFVWASIGKGELQIQSYNNVSSYLEGYPKCSLLDNEFFGTRKYIKKYEVVFVNWEKLVQKDRATGSWKNSIMKDQEGNSFIDVINETKRRRTKIILIIDESHIGSSNASRIAEFKNTILVPDITIEISATPFSNPNVSVDPADVVAEGMIKESIIVNEGIDDSLVINDDETSEKLVLRFGYEKRLEVLNEYQTTGEEINPLVLIQIPNKERGEAKINIVKDFLREKGITLDNGKLKIWLSGKEHDFDKDKIKDSNDTTEFLIFKTAVATGWDCPRAHILVKFREGNSETFEIQTIGRILRTATAKSYNNYILDNAYIFTNLANFETHNSGITPNAIKTEMSYFRKDDSNKDIYKPIKLNSYYRSRQGDYNSADSRYYKYFEEEFCTYFDIEVDQLDYTIVDKMIQKGFIDDTNVNVRIIQEDTITTYNIDQEQESHAGTQDVTTSESDLLFAYYDLIKQNLNGLGFARSKSPINGAIIETFEKYYTKIERSKKIVTVQKLVIKNQQIFTEILSKSTSRFRDFLVENAGKTGVTDVFEIQSSKAYSRDKYTIVSSELALYSPFRMSMPNSNPNQVNKLEKAFVKYLDKNKEKIDWHWQNGAEQMQINFGISYNNGMSTFQPDWIVRFKDGTIGIFDTKPIGERVEDTKAKAEALYKYLEEENKTRDPQLGKLIGGIVVSNTNPYRDFYVYNEEEYVDFGESQSNWILFDTLLNRIK